ncbi:uncharacterized protein [Zea mays]|nr:uncharacterized protein LOC100383644 isoform X2 [Zea mays]
MEVLKKSHTSVEDSDHIFLESSGLQDGLSCKKDLHSCGTKASDEEISDRLQENHDNTQPSDNHNYSVDQTQLPFLQALLRVQMKRSHRFLDKLPVVHWHLLTDKSIDPTYLVVMTATAAVGAATLLQRVIQIRTKPTPPNPRRPSSVQAFHSSTSCAGHQSRAIRKAVAQSAVHRFSAFKLLKRFSRVSSKN